jgi:hypothetical protein
MAFLATVWLFSVSAMLLSSLFLREKLFSKRRYLFFGALGTFSILCVAGIGLLAHKRYSGHPSFWLAFVILAFSVFAIAFLAAVAEHRLIKSAVSCLSRHA